MTRLLLAGAALVLALAPATTSQATTCVAGACVCDSPCTDCPVICVYRNPGPYVDCVPTPDFVVCV